MSTLQPLLGGFRAGEKGRANIFRAAKYVVGAFCAKARKFRV